MHILLLYLQKNAKHLPSKRGSGEPFAAEGHHEDHRREGWSPGFKFSISDHMLLAIC